MDINIVQFNVKSKGHHNAKNVYAVLMLSQSENKNASGFTVQTKVLGVSKVEKKKEKLLIDGRKLIHVNENQIKVIL